MRLEFTPAEVDPGRDRLLARTGCPPGRAMELEGPIDRALGTLRKLVAPVASYVTARGSVMTDGSGLSLQEILIPGRELAHRLAGSSMVSIFAATLGRGPEHRARELSGEGEHLASFLLDSAASAAVERLGRLVHSKIGEGMEGFTATARCAPGYGDFHLDQQAFILDLAGASSVGIRIREGTGLMIPVKSMTGVTGWIRQSD